MATRRSLDSGRAEYEARLQELFEESDLTDKGFLNGEEVNALCSRLQLGRLKEKVVQALQNRSAEKNKVVYEDFRHVFFSLLEELEAQKSKSPRKSQSKGNEDHDRSPKASPKLVIGLKKYGRRSLPIRRESDMNNFGPPEGSYTQFLQELDTKDRSSPSVEGVAKHSKRRRHGRQPAGADGKTREETYEAEGQLPTEDESGAEMVSMRQLTEICRTLGVGGSGFLNQAEFGSVCATIGVGDIQESELWDMFSCMDRNNDGLVSLAELVSGLPRAPVSEPATSDRLQASTHSRMTPSRSRSHSRSRAEERKSLSRNATPSKFVSGDSTGLFSSIESSFEGFARSEDIVDFWESLDITGGADILAALGYNPQGKLRLSDLTAALDQELDHRTSQEAVQHAALATYQQEVRHLKSVVEQSQEETMKLRQDLTDSNARNTLLAREVDETHAQLDKSWELKLMTVDQKYQEQLKAIQVELDQEREAGAAQASRLRAQLEEVQTKSGHEEQRLADLLSVRQKEMSHLEKELQESSEKLAAVLKQNEQIKKDLNKELELAQASPGVEDQSMELRELRTLVERKLAENKNLKDENDELLAQLEVSEHNYQTRQALPVTTASSLSDTGPTQSSRIPVLKGSDISLRHRNSLSSVEMSEVEDDDAATVISARAFKPLASAKRPKLGGSSSSLEADYVDAPSLGRELSQHETSELVERERKEMEQHYRMEVSALEDKHNAERSKILESFHQEKEWLVEEQKIKEETMLAEQLQELQTKFAQEKQDLVQKHESEKNYIHHRHNEEIKTLHERLTEAESHIETSEKMNHLVQSLEAQLTRCQDELCDLENQKSDLGLQLQQQEVALREEFDDEKRNLAERFGRELEQRQLSHRHQMEQLLARGAEGLTGKLRDDFLSLVRKHTEDEVGRSQAAILTQLQKDRSGIAAILEQEKSMIYETAENQKLALMEKYEDEIVALREELAELRQQVEAAKQAELELADKEPCEMVVSQDTESLKREMEEELMSQVEKVKASFDSEKKELETQKTLLEDELAELQGSLEAEKKKTSDTESLKETLKILKAEKREVEGMVEGMKEKLFQAYQQKGADWESKAMESKAEGWNLGKQEGLALGREEGEIQGRQQGHEEGYSKGKQEGLEEGKKEGKVEMDKTVEELTAELDSLRREKTSLENSLSQEIEKSHRVLQQAQDRKQLKASFDLLLGEKHNLEVKHQEICQEMAEEHEAEKSHLMEEIGRLESQRLEVTAYNKTVEADLGMVHQELELAQQALDPELGLEHSESSFNISDTQGAHKEQMTLLNYQLKEAQTAQHELGYLKEEYKALVQDKADLEETVRRLRAKLSEDDNTKIKSQMAQIQALSEDKRKIQLMLEQTSEQLVKASTSMALAQSKFVRELESLKQKAKSMVEKENYTQLQISLVDHQRLVITLQDAIREREALVDRIIKESEEQEQRITRGMEAKVVGIQNKLDTSQEQLVKQREKCKHMCSTNNRRILVLKDLYVENADLMKTLADSEDNRRRTEKTSRKLMAKCAEYKKTVDRLCHALSR